LTKIEHTYAPPFSSAKDPCAIAGYVASNIVSGAMPVVTWRQMQDADRNHTLLLDVRTPEEHAFGAIRGSVNIPLDEIRNRLDELPTDRMIYLYCAVGLRGYLALKILTARGFKNVKNLSGGYKTYATATAQTSSRHCGLDPQSPESFQTIKIDACGLQCPGPIMKIKQAIDAMNDGERVEMTATDAGFSRDAQAWCNTTGNLLISNTEEKGKYTVVIEKSSSKSCKPVTSCDGKAKTLIMFSDDLDKALATFVLANGAAATGQKVSIFFTFWGLNVIKKVSKPKVKKDLFGKMFGMMLPSSSLKLSLSKMSMLGIGDRMMRHIMKRKGIDSLETLRQQALNVGVEFIACQMSMDVMGVKREELLDEVTIGGVATYMERAETANVNLFI
jgi:peroxiredoxin family protein/rhodanese-related sulfurtransferase/TusA-related sulfurtransferase